MEKYEGLIAQFARFVVIGIMNTVINFAILNILSSIFIDLYSYQYPSLYLPLRSTFSNCVIVL